MGKGELKPWISSLEPSRSANQLIQGSWRVQEKKLVQENRICICTWNVESNKKINENSRYNN